VARISGSRTDAAKNRFELAQDRFSAQSSISCFGTVLCAGGEPGKHLDRRGGFWREWLIGGSSCSTPPRFTVASGPPVVHIPLRRARLQIESFAIQGEHLGSTSRIAEKL
jgi:hypothetical protein